MSYVFDASALIALLGKEKGWENVTPYVPKAFISTVNLSEVMEWLIREKRSILELNDYYAAGLKTIRFTEKHANICVHLRDKTRHLGLSLGDRAYIALGLIKKSDVITADRVWSKLDIPLKITIIR